MRAWLRSAMVCIAVCCAALPAARADGGRLRFSKPAGPFLVTLFTSPEPLTPGPADFSVLVQDAASEQILSGAEVTLRWTSADGRVLQRGASHGAATNRLLQATEVDLPMAGVWRVHIDVRTPENQSAALDTEVDVEPGSRKAPLAWIFALLPVFVIALFVAHQRQKLKQFGDKHGRGNDS